MAVAAAAFAVRGVLTYIIGYYGHTFGILVEADIRRDLSVSYTHLDVYKRQAHHPRTVGRNADGGRSGS